MIPKKIRRTIIVDDVEYEYCITGCCEDARVFIKNMTSNKSCKRYYEEQSITPSDVRKIILEENI
jgi:hypothetical protein